jgi:Na+/melibiose symporter-like transporter
MGGLPKWGYVLCSVGTAIGQVPTNLLLLYYLTQIVGLPASQAGLVVALPKLWDALIDPMFGGWVDRLSVRTGRRGPVALIASLGFLAALAFTFSLPQVHSSLETLVTVTLLQIISSTAQTALGVTQYALATELTSNQADLSKVLSRAAVSGQVLSVVFSILAPLLVVWSGGGAVGYSLMAIEVAAIAGLALLSFIFFTRRVPVRPHSAEAEEMPIFTAIRATTANHAFYCIIGFVMCVNAGAAILFGFMPYANQYVLGGAHGSLSVLEGVLGGTVLLGMLASPLFVSRFETMTSIRLCNAVVAVMLGLLFLASFGPIWFTWAALAGVGLASGVIGVLVQTATLAATRLKLGTAVIVSLGFYLGIMLAGMKIGGSLGGFVSGQLLHLVGFVSGGAEQSASTLQWLRAGYTLVPMVVTVIAGAFLQRVKLPSTRQPAA